MVFDEAGQPRFSHGIMIDITDRKKAEASLARQVAQLNALYEVSREVVTGHGPETVYLAAHNAARQTLPVDAFIITLLDESGQEAQDVYLFDHGQTWPNERSHLSERGMMAHVISTCKPLLIEDDLDGTSGALGTTLFGDPQDPSETRSLLVVPLIINDRPIGVMSVQHYVPRMYSGEHVQSLMTLANQVAIAIEHARLVQSYRLRDAALNAAANAIVITDRQGSIEWVNVAFTLLTGYTRDEAIGRNPRDLLRSGQQDASFYKRMWETILSGEVWHGHLINRRKDGSHYVEEMTITPVGTGNSRDAHFIAIKQDITERQAAERALRESEAKYRTVVEQASDGIAVVQRGIIMYANPRLAELRGEPLTEIIGRRFSLFVAPAERSKVLGMYRRRTTGEEVPRTYETVLLKKDQAQAVVELTPTSITYFGASADIVIIRDISERKLANSLAAAAA
jgi:PAS domain S-box-containing protein